MCIREKVFDSNWYFINLKGKRIDEDLQEFLINLVNGTQYYVFFPNKEDEKYFIKIMQKKIETPNSGLIIFSAKVTDVMK